MPYDLQKYRFQPGDKVEVLPMALLGDKWVDGKRVAHWDRNKGITGTLVRAWQPHPRQNTPPWLIVTPDPKAGFGEFVLQARNVRKLEIEESSDDN